MQVDLSTVSHSISEVTNGYKRNLVGGDSDFLDGIFPLMDTTLHHINIPSIFSYFLAYFCYTQILFVSIWPFHEFYLDLGPGTKQLFGLLSKLLLFSDVSNDSGTSTAFFIIISSFFFVCIGWVIFQLVFFHTQRRFIIWSLYAFRIIVDFISPLLILPSSWLVATNLNNAVLNQSFFNWFLLVLSALYYLLFLTLFIISYSLTSRSSFINITPFSGFNPYIINFIFIISSITFIVSYFITMFPDWYILVIQITHLTIFIKLLLLSFKFAFHRIYSAILCSSVIFTASATDIIMIVLFFFPELPDYIPFIISPIFLFLSFIGFTYYFHFVFNQVQGELTYPSKDLTDNQKNDHFRSIGLDIDEDTCLSYLYIAILIHSDFFIDWSFIKFIANTFPSDNAICSIVQIVSFFSCEPRLLNKLFSIAVSRRTLSLSQRFEIFQVYRVKNLRESSISLEATEKLAEIRQMSAILIQNGRAFWRSPDISLSFIEEYGRDSLRIKSLWDECIRDYPNNQKFSEEYSIFLTESLSEFSEAVIYKQRANQIENGKSFSIDSSFHSFVRSFPDYLKKGIFDTNGNLLAKKFLQKGSSSATSSRNTSDPDHIGSNSSKFLIDTDVEEQIASAIFRHGKLRLILHHSLEKRNSPLISSYIYVTIFMLFFSLLTSLILILVIINYFAIRRNSMSNISIVSKVRLNLNVAANCALMDWVNSTGRIGDIAAVLSNDIKDDLEWYGDLFSYIDMFNNMLFQAQGYLNSAKQSLRTLLDELTVLSINNNINLFEFSDTLLRNSMNTTFCHTGTNYSTSPSSLKTSVLYQNIVINKMLLMESIESWWESDESCEMHSNYKGINVASDSLCDLFLSKQHYQGQSLDSTLSLFAISFVPAVFAVTSVPVTVIIFMFISHSYNMINQFLELPSDIKEDCIKFIRKDIDNSPVQMPDHTMGTTSLVNQLIVSIFFSIIISLCQYCIIYFSKSTNDFISSLNTWLLYAERRMGSSVEAAFKTIESVLLNGTISPSYLNRQSLIEDAIEDLKVLENSNIVLLQGNGSISPCYGVDDILDQQNIIEKCEVSYVDEGIHEIYFCASTTQQISTFIEMALGILSNPDQHMGRIHSIEMIEFIHIASSHIWNSFEMVNNRLVQLCEEKYLQFVNLLVLFFGLGMLSTVLYCFWSYSTILKMQITQSTLLHYLKRLPPMYLYHQKHILYSFLQQNQKNYSSMDNSQNIIHNFPDGIILFGNNFIIESINQSISNLFGYSPEQLLGQSFSLLMSEENYTRIHSQFEIFIQSKNNNFINIESDCLKDNFEPIHCSLTLLKIPDNSNGEDIFALIIKDLSDITAQRIDVEERKKHSNNLLNNAFPSPIIEKISNRETISFVVPSASVIVLDIVNFSDHSKFLTPEEIFNQMSFIFNSIDDIIRQNKALTKLKILGDKIVVLSGLFSNENHENGVFHADKSIKFAFDCLTAIEEFSIKYNSGLSLRIGINTGGPLSAFLLESKQTVFDVIGKPIDLAIELQKTSNNGRIHISSHTKDLIESLNYDIEPRGEIKIFDQKMNTYYVSQPSTFLLQVSSSEFKT